MRKSLAFVEKMGTSEIPQVFPSHEVWELQERRIAAVHSHEWHVAASLGPHARGGAINYIQRVEETPYAAGFSTQ